MWEVLVFGLMGLVILVLGLAGNYYNDRQGLRHFSGRVSTVTLWTMITGGAMIILAIGTWFVHIVGGLA